MQTNSHSQARARRSRAARDVAQRWPALERISRAAAGCLCAAAVSTAAGAATAAPRVAVLVESPPSPVQPGATLVYRIHLSNLDRTTPTGELTVSADIPENTHVTQEPWGNCSPSRCNGSNVARYGDSVKWTKSLPPAASASWSLTLQVDNTIDHPPPAEGANLPLDVVVKSGAVKAADGTASVVSENTPAAFDLAVDGAHRAAPGEEVEYAFRYGNQGSGAVKGSLSFPIPSGARVVAASSGAVQKASRIEWDLGSVGAGFSDFRAVRLRLDPKLTPGSLLLVQPELRAAGRVQPTRAPLGVLVATPSPLAITAKVAPNPAVAGGTVVYKLEVTNRSPDAPTGNFNVSANIPMDGIVTQLRGADCRPYRCNGSNSSRHGSHVLWEVPSLAPGATAPLEFAFIVDKPTNAAPPPMGSLLTSHVTSSLGADTRLSFALGTRQTVGTGKPMEPLGAAPVAATPPPPAPPPPAAAPPSAPPAIPVATAAPEAEPEVDEIPEAEIAAELPAADDEDSVPAAEVTRRRSWKPQQWGNYCASRWKARRWDPHCAKIWWKQKAWDQYCKVEGRKHAGWKKFCARDYRHWRFVDARKKRHGDGDGRRGKKSKDTASR